MKRWRLAGTDTSRALWIPVLWLFFASLRYQIQPGLFAEIGYREGHPFPIIFGALMLAGLFVLYHRRFDLGLFVSENKLLVLLYAFMLISVLWSSYPWISFKRWVKTAGSLEMALIILSFAGPLASLGYVLRRYFVLTVPTSLALIFFLPSIGRLTYPEGETVWAGVSWNRNTLGQIALICCIYFSWNLVQKTLGKRTLTDAVILLLSLFLLLGSGSVTALFAYFFALFVLAVSKMSRVRRRHAGAAIVYIVVISGILYLTLEGVVLRESIASKVVGAFGRDISFTGRTQLWADLLEVTAEKPLLGHGFQSYWVHEFGHPLWEKHAWLPIDGHNGYLDVFIAMGAVGLLLLLLLIFNSYRKISKEFLSRYEYALLRMTILLALLLHNLNETSFCELDNPLWVMFLFAVVSYDVKPAAHLPAGVAVESAEEAGSDRAAVGRAKPVKA